MTPFRAASAAALLALGLTAVPALADHPAPGCPGSPSQVVRIYEASPTETNICVDTGVASAVIVVHDNGRVEYWRTGGLLDETVFCLPELVAYLMTPEVNYEEYAECAYHDHRVL